MHRTPLHRLGLALLTAAACTQAFAALKEGDAAPAFVAQASLAGKAFNYSLQEHLKQGPVVVYFYPSAFTNGCNLQAHTFAVHHAQFAAAGASVVGVSLDNIARLNDFSADPNYCAGKLAVASDGDGSIARSYQLAVRDAVAGRKDTRGADLDHGFAERTTFVVAANGKIVATVGGVDPATNVEQALAAVQKLASRPQQP